MIFRYGPCAGVRGAVRKTGRMQGDAERGDYDPCDRERVVGFGAMCRRRVRGRLGRLQSSHESTDDLPHGVAPGVHGDEGCFGPVSMISGPATTQSASLGPLYVLRSATEPTECA